MRTRFKSLSVKRYFLAVFGLYLLVGTLLVVNSCTTTGEARRIDEQRQVAVAGVVERDEQIATLKDAIKHGADTTTKTIELLSTELGGMRDELAEQVAAAEPGSEAWKEGVIAFIDGLSDDRSDFLSTWQDANEKLQAAEDGWGVAESLFSIAGGFFPALGIGGIFVRRAGNVIRGLNAEIGGHIADFNGVVDAMAAGGGPVNKALATNAMKTVDGLKDRVTNRRVQIGDKELKAVKAT